MTIFHSYVGLPEGTIYRAGSADVYPSPVSKTPGTRWELCAVKPLFGPFSLGQTGFKGGKEGLEDWSMLTAKV